MWSARVFAGNLHLLFLNLWRPKTAAHHFMRLTMPRTIASLILNYAAGHCSSALKCVRPTSVKEGRCVPLDIDFQMLMSHRAIPFVVINLTPDALLTTTRAVRRRLDLDRPVGREIIEDCIAIASQAPNAGNRQQIHFVAVSAKDTRASLAEIYRKGTAEYFERQRVGLAKSSGDPARDAAMKRVFDSAWYLREHLHEVPVHVIPCISGRMDGLPVATQASRWGTIFPAAWSFMLAARSRGLGTTFTTGHLNCEEEAATLLGIPFKEVMQAGLLPVAYTKGSRFNRATRPPTSQLVHWDKW